MKKLYNGKTQKEWIDQLLESVFYTTMERFKIELEKSTFILIMMEMFYLIIQLNY